MRKIIAAFIKDWTLLWRDKVGLLFLFLLPMCLVFFITLSHSEDPLNPAKINLLLMNHDSGDLSADIVKNLKQIDHFSITEVNKNKQLTEEQGKEAVADGEYQAFIIIPKNMSDDVERNIKQTMLALIIFPKPPPSILILFDPALPLAIKEDVASSIKLFALNVEANILTKIIAHYAKNPNLSFKTGILGVKSEFVTLPHRALRPNPVQQNVPAWALFGMFFIITPLSGVMVKERSLGVMERLLIAPVNSLSLMMGKVITFVIVNMLQLFLMLLVGVLILPLFNMPMLNVTDHIFLIILTGFISSLAAIGFGMLVGSFVRTPEQSTVLGPFVIVIAAAIGGILIPSYLLPHSLQIAGKFSPLQWAHTSFLDIFVRDANLQQITPNLLKLLLFFSVTMLLAVLKQTRRPR